MSPRLFPVHVALICALLFAVPGAAVASAASADAPAAVAAKAAAPKKTTKKKSTKKKPTTAQRVTALSRSLNRYKAQSAAAQKQVDAVVKQQAAIGGQLTAALAQAQSALTLSSPAGILAVLQDPASGIPQLLDSVTTQATSSIRALLASGEYAVAVVTVGDNIASPTVLVSADVPDIGAPITLSGTVPIALPVGITDEEVNVRVGAVSLENDGTPTDPVFYAELNHFSVKPAGYTGDNGDAVLKGGMAGVNLSQVQDGGVVNCKAGANGCGAPVWSGPNPANGNLPFWPVNNKLINFDSDAGVKFQVSKMTTLSNGNKLASVTGASTGPIRVSTKTGAQPGLSLLSAEISLTILDPSVNPADPLA